MFDNFYCLFTRFEKELIHIPNKQYPNYIRITTIQDIGFIDYKVEIRYYFGYGKTRDYFNESGLLETIKCYDPFQNI